AMAHLWVDANQRRLLSSSVGGQCALHADRIHGHLRSSCDPLPVPDPSGDRPWAGGSFRSENNRACRRRGLLSMAELWFCLVAIMIAGYVVLDGFDLGAGITQLFVARSNDDKRLIIRTIGPVWDGNEVWLIAGGGTLYFAFPGLYSSSFSGFYLPLMVVLWL